MRTLLKIRLWPLEAELFRFAPYFSHGCLAFVAVVALIYSIMVHAKNKRTEMCLAENIYHEARGEPTSAKYVQGMLTLARVSDPDPQWPKTICGTVAQDRQYSWVLEHSLATKRSEQERWAESQRIALDLLQNAWTKYKLPTGWECVRYYKRTDGKGVSKNGQKFFDAKLFPVGTFGSHTAYQNKRGCKHPLPTV